SANSPTTPTHPTTQTTRRKKKNTCPPPPPHFPPPYATPPSNSSLDYRRSDARIVENGFATSGGLSESAKVVLGRGLINSQPQPNRSKLDEGQVVGCGSANSIVPDFRRDNSLGTRRLSCASPVVSARLTGNPLVSTTT